MADVYGRSTKNFLLVLDMSYTEIWCAYFWELSSQISLISQIKQSCLGYTTVKPRVRSKCKDVS